MITKTCFYYVIGLAQLSKFINNGHHASNTCIDINEGESNYILDDNTKNQIRIIESSAIITENQLEIKFLSHQSHIHYK